MSVIARQKLGFTGSCRSGRVVFREEVEPARFLVDCGVEFFGINAHFVLVVFVNGFNGHIDCFALFRIIQNLLVRDNMPRRRKERIFRKTEFHHDRKFVFAVFDIFFNIDFARAERLDFGQVKLDLFHEFAFSQNPHRQLESVVERGYSVAVFNNKVVALRRKIDKLIYLFHFKQRGLRGSVGLNDTVEDKVAVVGYVAEIAALRPFDRAVVFNLFDALIRKVPDKPACESVVSQKFFPVIVEVFRDCCSSRVRIRKVRKVCRGNPWA